MGMKRKTSPWLRALAGMALVALTACDVEGELDICPYNARLDYHYSPHGMERNELLGYVGKHCQYLFDEGGVLLDTIPLRGTAMLWGEFDLPPGAYTVVSWANLDSATAMPAVEPGRTTLDDLRPATSHPASAPAGFPSAGGWQADADALYYAYARFRVEAGQGDAEAGGICQRPLPPDGEGALERPRAGLGWRFPDVAPVRAPWLRIGPGI